MPPTLALADCARLITAVQEAGGAVPKPLTNILAAAPLLPAHSAPSDPTRPIVDAAVRGKLTGNDSTDARQCAAAQLADSTRGELRHAEPLLVEVFHGACAMVVAMPSSIR